MKQPLQINKLSLAGNDIGTGGAYPPLGFQPVWDAELGNGDYFGLYWPYGRENSEPIVCDMLHDEWVLQVSFSSVAFFVDYLEVNDWCRGDVDINDPGLVTKRFQRIRELLRNHPEEAVSQLQKICNDFPEASEYWFTLASQLRRIGNHSESHLASIRAFASNWAFGLPPNGTLRLLQNAKGKIDDPLVDRSSELTMNYGGVKENSNYKILKECISVYLTSPTPVLGILLNQNYGYMMYMETNAFQERNGFVPARWIEEHSLLCAKYLGDDRTQIC